MWCLWRDAADETEIHETDPQAGAAALQNTWRVNVYQLTDGAQLHTDGPISRT